MTLNDQNQPLEAPFQAAVEAEGSHTTVGPTPRPFRTKEQEAKRLQSYLETLERKRVRGARSSCGSRAPSSARLRTSCGRAMPSRGSSSSTRA
jgi:hypothetical protein